MSWSMELGLWWQEENTVQSLHSVCPLSDAEGALESLIPEQAFWPSRVWAVLLPCICVGGWLEAGVLHF